MKKKFVLTLALVLMVAASLMAAPVELKGSFKAGYKFTFENPIKIAGAFNDGSNQVVIDALSVSTDFWKVSISDAGSFFKDTTGNITLYLDKALAEEGVDMGDVSLSVVLGNKSTMDALSVYSDPDGTYDLAAGKLQMTGALSTGVTIGHAKLGSAYIAFDPLNASRNLLASVKVTPVDGISATFGWAKKTAASVDGAINGSVKVDVAALADLDMALTASAIALYDLDDKNVELLAAANTEIEGIGLWAEYTNLTKKNGLGVGASYDVNDKLSVSGSFRATDLAAIKTTYSVSASASYGLFGGATYDLGLGYAYDTTAAKGLFSMTPTVKVTF
ncbi:MAG TPA: hypothetical protein DCR02_03320 [Sphaerochaeta sp.]|nr:hypothetical protein [Sphaerochaeta sp.]HCU29679.1 hypothetical protein [Sphaerochaeta sp.]